MLWASANHSSTARALSLPRTDSRVSPMRRAQALGHSAFARYLYSALPGSLAMRWCQSATPGLSSGRGA